MFALALCREVCARIINDDKILGKACCGNIVIDGNEKSGK